jgi:hypothetical protein
MPATALGRRRRDGHLDLLGRPLADQHVVLALDVVDDRLVHLVATAADGAGGDDAGQGDHGHVGGAAADVDHHVPGSRRDVETRTDGGRHRLLDEVDLAGAGGERRLAHGALLDARDARRNADDDARPDQAAPVVGTLDEVAQHRLGDLEVRDHAVLDRADGADLARRAAQHLLGVVTDGEHAVAATVLVANDRHDARLGAHQALAVHVDQRRGRARRSRRWSRRTSDPVLPVANSPRRLGPVSACAGRN